ncbi:MAG: hypothetical protein JOY78_20260 [Pseudonocardia sp.]|nr:hypothetical protein [Pseudonocardia sp.]
MTDADASSAPAPNPPNPDLPPDRLARLHTASAEIGKQIHKLMLDASIEGFKDGMETAARICENALSHPMGQPRPTEVHAVILDTQVKTITFLRDQIRLGALAIGLPTDA